jgi:phosphoenolpyruvate carboxylase
MQRFFTAVPKRRDRRQHIGLLAYSRSLAGQTLPRAITFTAALYSLGIPPELIGLGRTLRDLSPADLELLHEEYPNLSNDTQAAGHYLNRDNLEILAKKNKHWKLVQEDILSAEATLGVSFGPHTKDQLEHQQLSTKVLHIHTKSDLEQVITKMAILRRSLG